MLIIRLLNQSTEPLTQVREEKFKPQSGISKFRLKSPQEKVVLETGFGGSRIIDMLIGEQLPRI